MRHFIMKPILLALPLLFLACSKPDVITDVIVREKVVVKEVEVLVEVPVEVVKEVEVIREIEVFVPLADCPPVSEVDWLIENLEYGRWTHQHWSEVLRDNPPEEGSMLYTAVVSSEAQLEIVAVYDRRLSVVRHLQRVCIEGE